MPRQRQVRRAVPLVLVTLGGVLALPAVAAAALSYTIQRGSGASRCRLCLVTGRT
jgi:hypothetical protein